MTYSASTLLELMRERIAVNIDLHRKMLGDECLQQTLLDIAMEVVQSLRKEGKVLLFGNGGSAADAQHLAAEFTGRYLRERHALPALALNANTSAITAIGNDYGFEWVFARQVEALGRRGDVCVGITTSGNSPNVLRGLQVAKSKSMITVAMTGSCGGMAFQIADYAIRVPSSETPRIQECHILAGHMICEIVEQVLCSKPECQCDGESRVSVQELQKTVLD